MRASADAVFREKEGRKGIVRWNKEKDRKGKKGGKAKEAMSKAGSKKARAAKKERVGIEREMAEAEGEIRSEERERNMTETLKLLFALYFRVVKLDYRTPLLPAALEGLARFAHLVNIDFFRDLLEVLKGIIKRGAEEEEEAIEEGFARRNDQREKLLCIVTAFELLQGQGSSILIPPLLNHSLTAFVDRRGTEHRSRRIRQRSVLPHSPARPLADLRRDSLRRSKRLDASQQSQREDGTIRGRPPLPSPRRRLPRPNTSLPHSNSRLLKTTPHLLATMAAGIAAPYDRILTVAVDPRTEIGGDARNGRSKNRRKMVGRDGRTGTSAAGGDMLVGSWVIEDSSGSESSE